MLTEKQNREKPSHLISKKRISPLQSGFTIVELLIVIVVIGILAAITIVAYTGVTNHARLATLESDLNQAAQQLELDNTTTGTYPAALADADNGAGINSSPGTTWQYTYASADNSYCLTGTNNAVSYYISSTNTVPTVGACPGDVDGGSGGGGGGGGGAIADGTVIQTITSANCPSTRTRAVDARDNHSYWVQELADGNCWMLTNLAYAGGGTNTYSDTKTLTNGTSSSSTYTIASYYVPTDANVTTDPTAPSTSTDGGDTSPQYGYLYNWCGAMGGQATAACANASTPTSNPSVSICPAGWRLPTGDATGEDATGEQVALNNAINSGSSSTDVGLRTTWFAQYAGYWSSGFGGQDSYGYYWSATQVGSTYAAGRGSSGGGVSGGGYDKSYGFSVRCIAN